MPEFSGCCVTWSSVFATNQNHISHALCSRPPLTQVIIGDIDKRSLISLLLIIMECKNPEKMTLKLKNTLADEERGKLAFAAKIA
ncbi:hypothetical protein JVT61DRAFT_1675 [Boletus reticuloceps]|uniref:Uncharacterized protein n=1 Tax=Boletus reticuloceps TaxID=495285 RepID=A0A8I2YTZ1_9AGAM|nr:hypothetical protein JVT61DRAFT_1675 [Boletus reticuloceps]